MPPTGDADRSDRSDHADHADHQVGHQVDHADAIGPAEKQRAAAALQDAFARLAPQGSDAWNFLSAFTILGDRFGPYHPGASGLSDALEAERQAVGKRSRRDRLRRDRAAPGEKSELDEALGHVVEAFRFLSARVARLEERLAAEDRPVEGAAWLVPARELGAWTGPVAAHVLAQSPGGTIVHADCGEGVLLEALAGRGADAHGVEPRGAVALRALERGSDVTIAEASEHLAGRAAGTLGGIVLSGVVDRLPLHDLLPLLGRCRESLARHAPLVVVTEPGDSVDAREAAATDLLEGRPLHEVTWELLLDRAGFVEVAPLLGDASQDPRFALSARTPS
jgi:hypothetical protein